jgi:hypothetical protein
VRARGIGQEFLRLLLTAPHQLLPEAETLLARLRTLATIAGPENPVARHVRATDVLPLSNRYGLVVRRGGGRPRQSNAVREGVFSEVATAIESLMDGGAAEGLPSDANDGAGDNDVGWDLDGGMVVSAEPDRQDEAAPAVADNGALEACSNVRCHGNSRSSFGSDADALQCGGRQSAPPAAVSDLELPSDPAPSRPPPARSGVMQNYRDIRAMVRAWENGQLDSDLLKEIGVDSGDCHSRSQRSRKRPERDDFVSGDDVSENEK